MVLELHAPDEPTLRALVPLLPVFDNYVLATLAALFVHLAVAGALVVVAAMWLVPAGASSGWWPPRVRWRRVSDTARRERPAQARLGGRRLTPRGRRR